MKSIRSRFACSTLGLALSCQLLGCAPDGSAKGIDPQGDPESVCGRTSKLQNVETYDGSFGLPTAFVNRHRLAVGLLRWRSDLADRYFEQHGNVQGVGWCSGTLIADDLFLTAGHCLDPEDSSRWQLPREKDGLPLRPAELAREFIVQFRFEANDLPPEALSYVNDVGVVRLEEHRNQGVDYAILRLSAGAGVNNGVTRVSAIDSRPGLPIAILQHPGGDLMKVGSGSVARLLGPKITYATIDTLGGSSGSGILDAVGGKLVGIHTNGGCTSSGDGENSGVTIGALLGASDIMRGLVDRSRDFLVGDWNGDGHDDLGVFVDGCLYPDADHDRAPDLGSRICPDNPNADQYFAGNWQGPGPSQLGWRHGDCVSLDTNPKQSWCFDPPFEVLIADWNGDGRSDLGIRTGRCIDFDTNLDGVLDTPSYCTGNGAAEDEYLAGRWDGAARASIVIRRGNLLYFDLDRDGNLDPTPRVYGKGGDEDQYLVGDWDGDGRTDLGVRENTLCRLSHDATTGLADEERSYDDFWSKP